MRNEEFEWWRKGVCSAISSPSSPSSGSESVSSLDSIPSILYRERTPSSSSFSSSASVEEFVRRGLGALTARGVGSSGVTGDPRLKLRRGATGARPLLCGAIVALLESNWNSICGWNGRLRCG